MICFRRLYGFGEAITIQDYSSTLRRSPCGEDALIVRYPAPNRNSGNNHNNNNNSRCLSLAARVEVHSTLRSEAILSKHRPRLTKPRATYTARRKSVCQLDVCFWIRKRASGRPNDQHARTTSSSTTSNCCESVPLLTCDDRSSYLNCPRLLVSLSFVHSRRPLALGRYC